MACDFLHITIAEGEFSEAFLMLYILLQGCRGFHGCIITQHLLIAFCNFWFNSNIAGYISWKKATQCWISTCVSIDQRPHISFLGCNTHYINCTSSLDISGYYSLHPCIYANRMGLTFGEWILSSTSDLSFFLCNLVSIASSKFPEEFTGISALGLWFFVSIIHISSDFSPSLHLGEKILDCSSFEALGSKSWNMGISPDPCARLWSCNGLTVVHTRCLLGVVSFCLRVPDTNVIQPSI